MADTYDSLLGEFEKTPVQTTQAGKKLTTTACVNEIVGSIMNVIAQTNAEAIAELTFQNIKDRVAKEIGVIPKRIEIRGLEQTKIVTGAVHEKFETVLDMVSIDIPVYLTGKAGTGKNVICKQVADALGLDFYFTNAVTQEYKLTGFIDANGVYQETQFYKAFTQGGLFFLDEMDASVPETLVILNAAIANRYFDFPCGKKTAHPNFRVIAAGNTLGTGADINYTGRYSLDRASLNRFVIVKIDYSPAIEDALSFGNKELLDFVHAFRNATDKAGVECLCSYRNIDYITKLENRMKNLSDVLDVALTKGLDVDTLNVIRSRLKEEPGMDSNKYSKAFNKIKN